MSYEKKRVFGFTLVELIIVLAIIGILSAIAYPSMTSNLASNRVRSQGETLLSVLMFARSEAISRGTTVTIQPSDSWQDPIVVSIPGTTAETIKKLKEIPGFSGNTTISPATNITVNNRGSFSGVNLTVCHGDTDLQALIQINQGALSLTTQHKTDTCPSS